ncbi:MAG: preprotein translocase subunit YajC [Woeseia sp.]|nr:preprotein translocase subunit YajC [Woeseia sp.]
MFISPAYAQGAAPADPFGFFLPMIIIFVAFYFLMIRPQQKRQKAHTQMIGALTVGDEVLTAGGILGVVSGVSEHYVTLKIADEVEVKIQKQTISAVVPRGTVEAA